MTRRWDCRGKINENMQLQVESHIPDMTYSMHFNFMHTLILIYICCCACAVFLRFFWLFDCNLREKLEINKRQSYLSIVTLLWPFFTSINTALIRSLKNYSNWMKEAAFNVINESSLILTLKMEVHFIITIAI